jgi:hypothetical protein
LFSLSKVFFLKIRQVACLSLLSKPYNIFSLLGGIMETMHLFETATHMPNNINFRSQNWPEGPCLLV